MVYEKWKQKPTQNMYIVILNEPKGAVMDEKK